MTIIKQENVQFI